MISSKLNYAKLSKIMIINQLSLQSSNPSERWQLNIWSCESWLMQNGYNIDVFLRRAEGSLLLYNYIIYTKTCKLIQFLIIACMLLSSWKDMLSDFGELLQCFSCCWYYQKSCKAVCIILFYHASDCTFKNIFTRALLSGLCVPSVSEQLTFLTVSIILIIENVNVISVYRKLE